MGLGNFTRSAVQDDRRASISVPLGRQLQNSDVAETLDRMAVCVSTPTKSRIVWAPGRMAVILVEPVDITKIGDNRTGVRPTKL